MAPQSTLILFIIVISQVGTGFSKRGATLGERCDRECVGEHVMCNQTTKMCQCQADYPFKVVSANKGTLCAKGAKLGQECLQAEMCLIHDENSDCAQTGFNPTCQCKADFHIIYDKTQSRDRCVREAQLLSRDLLTLLIVGTVMTLFCGLTCLVLRIFARARFGPRRGHYASTLAPPAVTLSADQGDPRPQSQSRNSSQRSSLAENSRRQSGSLLAPPTRPESRRASNSSIRSTNSNRSQRSYSLRNPSGHQNFNNQLHPSLQHRPSDPETRSQLSLGNNKDNVSGGSGSATSVTFNLPPSPATPSTSASASHSLMQKAKRSGSAGTLPV